MSNTHKPALEPAIITIFGITGDLSRRYLLPSLYHLVKEDMLHEQTEIIGITRGSLDINELLGTIELCVSEVDGICDPATVQKLKQHLTIRQMDVTQPAEYDSLHEELDAIEDRVGVCMNRLYYLSIPPTVAQPIITYLGEHGLNQSCQHGRASTRLLVEKPFGYDQSSAQELVEVIDKQFGEEQVYRIDHYLAKETVQNILAFRFNNPIFEPLWNSEHIDYIEVLADEAIGIEGRVNFYEQVGALRDFVQSHLLQILALVTMEQPSALSSDQIHRNKLELMEAMQAVAPNKVDTDTVRGQYEGYKDEVDNQDSQTETFAAIRVFVDNDRWRNVPMIIKTGKALTEKRSEVRVVFRPTSDTPHHNVLAFHLQPNEGIGLSLRIKKPGFGDEIEPAELSLSYESTFHGDFTPTAYERVLVDAVRGDHTLFATSGEVLESWRVVNNVLEEWDKSGGSLVPYPQHSAGPTELKSLYPSKHELPDAGN